MDHWESFHTCAGDYRDEWASRNLKCRYNHHNSPFLIIAPLKEEMLSLVPKVSIFRDALYDIEIELLKTDAHKLVGTTRFIFLFSIRHNIFPWMYGIVISSD